MPGEFDELGHDLLGRAALGAARGRELRHLAPPLLR